ncbi:MAG: LysR family transcriptional regulator [Propionibacteriaceae bacterium]|jgi:DNA-binding transcriptional LysR family regulator|nr:LysR family transcriptional regulator [Propionibacteriaceae bacterium]
MDLMALRYFQQVALDRNFSRAASHFFISQSALSRQIATLEAELGVKLLRRDTRNVALTAAGQILFERGPLLLTHYETILRCLASVREGREGVLAIATVSDFRSQLVELVEVYSGEYPEVRVIVDDLPLTQLTDAVVEGVYDVALTLDFLVPSDEHIDVLKLGQDRLVAVSGPKLPNPLGPKVTLAELAAQNIVVPAQAAPPLTRQLWLTVRELGGSGSFHEAPNSRSAMLEVTLGRSVSIMPLATVRSQASAGEIAVSEIDHPEAHCDWCLVVWKERDAATTRNFVAVVRRLFRQRTSK